MNQLKEICRYVKIVEKTTESLEQAKNTTDFKDLNHLFDAFYPKIEEVKKEFMGKYKCSRARAVSAYQDALNGEYIKTMPVISKASNYKIPKYVEITTKGRTLNSTLFKIPTGRYNAWLSDNGALITFATGSAVTGIVVLIWRIIEINT